MPLILTLLYHYHCCQKWFAYEEVIYSYRPVKSVCIPFKGWRHFISKGIFHVGAWNLAICFINQLLYSKCCQVTRYVSVYSQILNVSACRKCTFRCKCRVPEMKTADLISLIILKIYHHQYDEQHGIDITTSAKLMSCILCPGFAAPLSSRQVVGYLVRLIGDPLKLF